MQETWIAIPNTTGYFISNFGRVSSIKSHKPIILKQKKDKNGYKQIGLCCDDGKRKWFLIHRLVMTMFCPIDNMENMEVNHKDENKDNNHLDNLEWTTSKENCNYGTRNQKCSESKCIKVLCEETGVIYNSCKEASEILGIDKASINMCCTGYRNRKTAGGFHWRYANE